MIDALTGSLTMFDVIVFVVVFLSALMSLSRGFFRELITVIAMFVAGAAAYFSRQLFRDNVANMLPENAADYAADAIVLSVAFLVVFVTGRILGRKYASLIQGSEEITLIDRASGLVFGVARGFVVIIGATWLLTVLLPTEQIPDFIAESATYPIFENIASTINASAPNIADEIEQRQATNPV